MTKHLDTDVYQRAAVPPTSGVRHRLEDRAVFSLFCLLSLALIVMSKLEMSVVRDIRATIQDGASEVLEAAAVPVAAAFSAARKLGDVQTLTRERDRLLAENERLKGFEARAQALEQQSAAMSELAHMVAQQPLQYLSARVVSGNGPFVRVAMLDAGREHGVRAGYPAMSAHGLVGRVVATGRVSSRLLLVTDYNSRIPVLIGPNAIRAVMQGDNGPLPKIAYLAPGSEIHPGDVVFTSGVGGLFPPGLKAGVVVDTGEALRIEPAAKLDRLYFVTVLKFRKDSEIISEEERTTDLSSGVNSGGVSAGTGRQRSLGWSTGIDRGVGP